MFCFVFIEVSIITAYHECSQPSSFFLMEASTLKPLDLYFWAWTTVSPRRHFWLSQLEKGVALASSG